MCQINTDPMVHRSGYVQVVVPPTIVHTGQPQNMVVREGDNVTLSCNANGYPPPHIVWRREDGDDILLGGKKLNILEGASLRLEKISRLNMGDYLCVASNGIPPSASNRFSIKVQCKSHHCLGLLTNMLSSSSSDVLDPESERGRLQRPGERHGGVSQRGLPEEYQLLGQQQGSDARVE